MRSALAKQQEEPRFLILKVVTVFKAMLSSPSTLQRSSQNKKKHDMLLVVMVSPQNHLHRNGNDFLCWDEHQIVQRNQCEAFMSLHSCAGYSKTCFSLSMR